MALSKRFLDELRIRLSLSDIIGGRMKLVRAGREFKGCCPFHNESTPSFTVNNEKGFYHCFGCGAHGDIVNFIMQHDNLPFMEAVEHLAMQAGVEVPRQSPEAVKKYKKQSSLYELVEEVAKWFEVQLREPQNRQAMAYFKGRGLSDDTISRFRLGFAPSDGEALVKHLKRQGFNEQDMIEAGVARKSTYGGRSAYSFFRDRVMFPVTDVRGRCVAFGGRILPPEFGGATSTDKPPPKYINSSETPLFHKGYLLYAQSLARESVLNGHALIVVEGYMDVIALAQTGIDGAVAPLGTALTENQILELWKLQPNENKTPILCFDGDNAGRRAAVRAMERALPLLKPDHSLAFAFLPEGQDPDTLIQKEGRKAFEKLMTASISLMDVMWNEAIKARNITNPEAKAGVQFALEQQAEQIADRHVQQFYMQEIRNRVYQVFSSFQRNKGAYGRNRKFSNQERKPTDPIRPRKMQTTPVALQKTHVEHILLAAVLNYPKLIHDVEEKLGMMKISDQNLGQFRYVLIECLLDEDLKADELYKKMVENGFQNMLDALLCESLYRQAVFVRPGQTYELVKDGWLYTWEREQMKQHTA